MKRTAGFGLIELLLTIAVAVVLIGMGVGIYSRASTNARIGQLIEAVTTVDQVVRTRYANQYSYTGLSVTAINADLPAHLRACPAGGCATPTITTPWGGTLVVGPRTPATGYELTLAGPMPVEACTDLLVRTGGHFSTIQVNGSTVKTQSLNPIDVAGALAACRGNRFSGSNTGAIAMVLVGS